MPFARCRQIPRRQSRHSKPFFGLVCCEARPVFSCLLRTLARNRLPSCTLCARAPLFRTVARAPTARGPTCRPFYAPVLCALDARIPPRESISVCLIGWSCNHHAAALWTFRAQVRVEDAAGHQQQQWSVMQRPVRQPYVCGYGFFASACCQNLAACVRRRSCRHPMVASRFLVTIYRQRSPSLDIDKAHEHDPTLRIIMTWHADTLGPFLPDRSQCAPVRPSSHARCSFTIASVPFLPYSHPRDLHRC